ncbi:MAG: electron transport complex subunit RsxG [Gammaproteobacteria bacterium]
MRGSGIMSVGILAGMGFFAAFMLSKTQHTFSDRIEANERAWEMRQIRELLKETDYDNDVFSDLIYIDSNTADAQLLGSDERPYICRARLNDKARAAVFQVTAQNGYSGPIRLLVGIYADGRLAGVRVASHRETPGLGDKIEARNTDWILQFNGRSLRDPSEAEWLVKKDGGNFDQITGATVSPRAVVKAVKNALIYFNMHRDEIFERPAEPLEPEASSPNQSSSIGPSPHVLS